MNGDEDVKKRQRRWLMTTMLLEGWDEMYQYQDTLQIENCGGAGDWEL